MSWTTLLSLPSKTGVLFANKCLRHRKEQIAVWKASGFVHVVRFLLQSCGQCRGLAGSRHWGNSACCPAPLCQLQHGGRRCCGKWWLLCLSCHHALPCLAGRLGSTSLAYCSSCWRTQLQGGKEEQGHVSLDGTTSESEFAPRWGTVTNPWLISN